MSKQCGTAFLVPYQVSLAAVDLGFPFLSLFLILSHPPITLSQDTDKRVRTQTRYL